MEVKFWMEQMTAKDIMVRDVVTLGPDDPLSTAHRRYYMHKLLARR